VDVPVLEGRTSEMSIVADIKQARDEHVQHLATHKCSQLKRCEERAELWQAYMGTAALWGQEPDDHARQRAHYERNAGRPAA